MEKIKTKVRFTSLDVAAMVQNLQRLIGSRLENNNIELLIFMI
jgi:predicted ribosome quality control (RQC) complex YloA/Tae2 family protein